jgi:DNA-binding CsgD family transcriptional regulator
MRNTLELIERAEPEQTIREALSDAARGEGTAVFLTGTAGIGKTAMLRRATSLARDEGCLLAHAVASRMERGLPFGLLGQAIVALGGNPVEDVAELAGAGGQSARFYRTLRWLGELSDETAVVVALDDLHWADPDSLELLAFLCRRLSVLRVLVIGTLRPGPAQATALAHELASAGYARVTALEPLSRSGSAELLSRALGRVPGDEEASELWRACAGTPLLLQAAGRALAEGTPLRQLEEGPLVDSTLLLRRFADVGGQGFDYVKAGAILGVHFDHRTATALSGVPPTAADDALVQLVRAGVLEDLDSGSVAFVHPLFVQALLDEQPSALRRRQHAEAFAIVVAQHGPDALAAEHAALAGLVGDPLAIEITSRAGATALAQGALRAASKHFGNAVWLAGEDPPVDLVLRHGQALVAEADVEQARALCAGLVARELDAGTRSQALRLLARVEMLASRPSRAQQLFMEAAAVAPDRAAMAEVLCDALLTCLASAPARWILDTALGALELVAEGSPQQRLVRFIESYAALVCRCDPRDAATVVEEVIRIGARAVWPGQGWNLTLAVHALNMCKMLENFDGARAIFEREYAEAVGAGAPVLMSGLTVAYADVLMRLGRLEEALELVEHTSAQIDRRIPPWSDLAVAVLCSELGLDARSRERTDVLREFQREIPLEQYAVVSLWLHLLDGRAQFAAGLHEQASETMVRAAEVASLSGRIEPCLVPWAGVALDAHLAAGRVDRAQSLLADLEARSQDLPSRWPRAVIALGRAGLAAVDGPQQRADDLYAEAIEHFKELSQPLELAQALASFGTYLRRTGRPREARTPLAGAVAICEDAHAERLARLARAELAACGGRRRRRGEDRWELTAQEARVAALAAQGMANGQIAAALHLSPKTVSFHLQRVYSKLDIHSRRELIRRSAEFAGDRAAADPLRPPSAGG